MLSTSSLGEWKRSESLPDSLLRTPCFEAHSLPNPTSRKLSHSEKENLFNHCFKKKKSVSFHSSLLNQPTDESPSLLILRSCKGHSRISSFQFSVDTVTTGQPWVCHVNHRYRKIKRWFRTIIPPMYLNNDLFLLVVIEFISFATRIRSSLLGNYVIGFVGNFCFWDLSSFWKLVTLSKYRDKRQRGSITNKTYLCIKLTGSIKQ